MVATTTQTADFARAVGGEHVRVIALATPGIDPHEFQESPADLEALRTADVIVRNGAGLDGWLDSLLTSSGTHAHIVDTSVGIQLRHEDNGPDPHIWTNPNNAKTMVDSIEHAIESADPPHRADYAANLVAYSAQLDTLDREIGASIAALPNKKFVTTHDAFGYFVDHFHLEFVGSVIPSFDTNSETTAQQIQALVDAIKATGVRAIFTESTLPPKAAEALATQAHVRVIEGDNALYGDSLGPPGSNGDTYLKMMRHNAQVIASNL